MCNSVSTVCNGVHPALPCQRVHSHLLERAELVPLDLALSDLAIGNANDLDQFDGDAFPGSWNAHELPLVCATHEKAACHSVYLKDKHTLQDVPLSWEQRPDLVGILSRDDHLGSRQHKQCMGNVLQIERESLPSVAVIG
jgi:hypothetical protein